MIRISRWSAPALALSFAVAAADTLPAVDQIVPRDELTAVVDPVFVPADAAELPDDAWVLAVEIDGDARAYDLNLLNGHEVVNDVVGGRPIAAVWCPLAMTGVIYDRRHDEGDLTFEAAGTLKDASLVMRDRETDSRWSVMGGAAIDGTMAGEPLQETGLAVKATWGEWREKHPDTRVLSIDGREHETVDVYAEYRESDSTYGDAPSKDGRLPDKTPIFAFRWKDRPYAVAHDELRGGIVWQPEGDDGTVILLHRLPDAPTAVSTRAAVLPQDVAKTDDPEGLAARLDERLEAQTPGVERLPGFDTYWYTWAAENPETVLID